MSFTLQDANLHSPDAIMNRIVRQLNQMDGDAQLMTNEVFPLVELSDSEETYFTQDGLRAGMTETSISSESPVGDIEGLDSDTVNVRTFKKKIQPDKGVDTELNSQAAILNLFNAASDGLMEDLLLTRARIAWQGTATVDGMIGADGQTAHPAIPTGHVATPATAYSDHANATPIMDFVDAEYRITDDGSALGRAGPVTAYMSPSVLKDLKLNDDLQSEYDNVRALSQSQVAGALEGIDRIQVVRTQLVRTDANGQPVDDTGAVVEDQENAARDNVLEPYAGGANHRNIVVGAPGQVSAFMPWFLDRLAERGAAAPSGQVSIDASNGWMTQSWTQNDPLVTWFKAAQEVGFHVPRGENWYIIQDI